MTSFSHFKKEAITLLSTVRTKNPTFQCLNFLFCKVSTICFEKRYISACSKVIPLKSYYSDLAQIGHRLMLVNIAQPVNVV